MVGYSSLKMGEARGQEQAPGAGGRNHWSIIVLIFILASAGGCAPEMAIDGFEIAIENCPLIIDQ